jgi:hypothetical protein
MISLLLAFSLAQEVQLRAFPIPTSGAGVAMDVAGEWLAQFVPSVASPPLRLSRRVGTGWVRTMGRSLLTGLSTNDVTVAEVELRPPYFMYATPRLNQDRGGMVLIEFDDAGELVSETQFAYTRDMAQFGSSLASLDDGTIAASLRGLGHVSRPTDGNFGGVSIGRVSSGTYIESQLIVPTDQRLFFDAPFVSLSYQLGDEVKLDGDWLVVAARSATFGAVHTYQRNSTGTYIETQVIDPPSPVFQAKFGRGLAIEDDLMVVGEPESDTRHGQAYVYRYSQMSQQWELGETLRPENPDTGLTAGDRFGSAVAIDEGRVFVSATNQGRFGAVYLFKPDPSGSYGPFESHTYVSSVMNLSTGGDLGAQIKVQDGFLLATDRAAERSIHAFSAALETDICDGSVADGIKLDSWLDSSAGLAANALRRRGLVLSNIPQDTRYILLGGLAPDASANGSLFGTTGLCMSPPLARMAFGVASSPQHLAILSADDLYPAGDRLMTVAGTIYVQGFCAPPVISGITNSWTNAFHLEIQN